MEEKRKFQNPTPGWVGAVILDDDNKPKGVPVEPGGSIWLSPAEERLTAEAPRLAEDNPFVKKWTCVLEVGPGGEPSRTEEREGVLVMSPEPARQIMSERVIPSQRAETAAAEEAPAHAPEPERAAEREEPAEVTGAPPIPRQPPVEGQPGPDEIVATPGAVEANDQHLERLAAERAAAAEAQDENEEESPTPVGEDGPKGTDQIGVVKEGASPALV